MTPPTQCLECGAPLTAADAGGLCPKCLLRLGLVSQLASGTLPAIAPGLSQEGTVLEPFEFGGYRILRLLGKGGMGAVYEAEQRETGRRVALKVLGHTLDTPEMRQRFLREGQLAAAVRHPNSVAVFSTEEIEGAPVITMELAPGGTLKELVKRRGPLPVAEAVEAVLQIIDGLEAAHTGGVLHRDIKPANCFLAPDGSVKVGDFGLSISTLVKAEQQLTQTGAVLGTPAFSSPEQLRAQEIDVRSDIYSVGATLYFLLTGKPTHDAETLVGLIAAVLERDPVDPQTLRPELPAALSRVVMRCLARHAGARFANYAELRAALLPFRAGAPRPAPLSLRILAGIIDGLVATGPWALFIAASGSDPLSDLLLGRSPGAALMLLSFLVWEILVITWPEGRWGAALGKALCGLRVARLNGDTPGFARSFGRWAVLAFASYCYLPPLMLAYSADEYRSAWMKSEIFWLEWLPVPLLVALFLTMRRCNGFAAVHDLLTRTRVVVAPAPVDSARVPMPPTPAPATRDEKIGPFTLGERVAPDLTLALDGALQRRVWIRHLPPNAPALEVARRDLGRASRLRWLTGGRGAEESWDAYEAPDGQPLARFLDAAQPWQRVRSWLHDLSEELRAGLDDDTLPAEAAAPGTSGGRCSGRAAIGLDRLWLTREGRVVLLDFPAPSAPPLPMHVVTDQPSAQAFLASLARAALALRVPLHAREFLQTLEARRFDSMALVAGNLRADLEKPAVVTFRRRLLSVSVPIILALLAAVTFSRVVSLSVQQFEKQWQATYADRVSPREFVEVHDYADTPKVRAWCLQVLAARYRDTIDNDAFWNHPKLGYTDAGSIRERIREAAESLPVVTAEEARTAERELRPRLREHRRFERNSGLLQPLGFVAALLACGGMFGVLWALATSTPPLLRLNDLALVNARGERASRLRVTLRGLLGWLPMFAGAVAVAVSLRADARTFKIALLVVVISLAVSLAGAIWTVLRRTRAPQDHLAGTWLVPR